MNTVNRVVSRRTEKHCVQYQQLQRDCYGHEWMIFLCIIITHRISRNSHDAPLTQAVLALKTPFLTTSLLLFFSIMTWNLAKSFNDLLFSTAALFFAHELESHLAMIPSFSMAFLTIPERAPRGRDVRARGVRVRCL